MPMGEMAAVARFIARILSPGFSREINGHVRLRAAVRLDVHMVAAEKPFGAIDRKLLGGVDVLAAAIPTFPG